MYHYIKGNLVFVSVVSVTVEAGGIGYKILIPASLFSKLPQIGEEILLHTSFVIRENSQALYGFVLEQEREMFEALMGVSGIGPKLALSLIGHMALPELHVAIGNHEIATLCRVPGIGKKTAERLIIELRDKLAMFPNPSGYSIPLQQNSKSQKVLDAMSALINLGYNQMTAQKAIKKTLSDLPEDVDLGTLITVALQQVSLVKS